MPYFTIILVIFDHNRIPAVGTLVRTANRPDKVESQTSIAHIIIDCYRRESLIFFEPQLIFPVKQIGELVHFLPRLQRQKTVADNVAVIIEPEIFSSKIIFSLAKRRKEIFKCKFTFASTNGICILDGIFRVYYRMNASPNNICLWVNNFNGAVLDNIK